MPFQLSFKSDTTQGSKNYNNFRFKQLFIRQLTNFRFSELICFKRFVFFQKL